MLRAIRASVALDGFRRGVKDVTALCRRRGGGGGPWAMVLEEQTVASERSRCPAAPTGTATPVDRAAEKGEC
jgi:hypothetical protein